jgi:ATP-dependent RNA helicase DeaD
VPSFEELHLRPSIATTLARLGWSPDDSLVREATPTAARGHNLIAITPPVPVYATPAVAGLLSRVDKGKRALILGPASQLDEWGALTHRLTQGAGLSLQVAHSTARVTRLLRAGSVDVVIATPETAVSLVSRSALKMEAATGILLAWPESWPDADSLTPLMQDLAKETQRIVYTAEPERVNNVMERFASKALTIGVQHGETPVGPVRTVSVPWTRRVQALADLVELLDPATLAVWTVDRSYHDAIAQVVSLAEPEARLVTGDAPPASTIIAFDLPTAERLRQLRGAGEVILLVPPGTESHVARIAAPRRPLQLPGPLDAIREVESAQRAAIVNAIETGKAQRSLLTLAPLFERHDPAAVAAALFELWTSSAQPTAPPPPEVPATSRIYVGVGKKDGASANDLVGVLTRELRVDRHKIGRIELREGYSLIEVPAQDAEQLAAALNGVTVRRKRVTARVDRGSSNPARRENRAPGRPARR